MLRSDKLLAIDEVTEACQLVVDHLEQFAKSLDNQTTAHLFYKIAEKHQSYVAQMDEQVRRMGELPSRPDSDREAVEHLVTLFQAAIAADREQKLLKKAEELEEQVREKVEQGLTIELPDEGRNLLTRIRTEVDQIRSEIKALRKS